MKEHIKNSNQFHTVAAKMNKNKQKQTNKQTKQHVQWQTNLKIHTNTQLAWVDWLPCICLLFVRLGWTDCYIFVSYLYDTVVIRLGWTDCHTVILSLICMTVRLGWTDSHIFVSYLYDSKAWVDWLPYSVSYFQVSQMSLIFQVFWNWPGGQGNLIFAN